MDNVTNVVNTAKKNPPSDKQLATAVGAGVAVVGYLVLRRRFNVKAGKMLLLASEAAVSEWVTGLERNGFKVMILSNSLAEQMTDAGFTLASVA